MLKSEIREDNKIYCEFSSSDIASSVYIPEEETLIITFKKGNIYKYHPVSDSKHDGFKSAISQGKYFTDHFIKSKDRISAELIRKGVK
jgi:hypothetical protein